MKGRDKEKTLIRLGVLARTTWVVGKDVEIIFAVDSKPYLHRYKEPVKVRDTITTSVVYEFYIIELFPYCVDGKVIYWVGGSETLNILVIHIPEEEIEWNY